MPPRSHSIRLQGPWDVTWSAEAETVHEGPKSLIVRLPDDWVEFARHNLHAARFERRFNRPTGLTDDHQIRIRIDHLAGRARLRLNDCELPLTQLGDSLVTLDVRPYLRSHNTLVIDWRNEGLLRTDAGRGAWGAVVVQIDEPSGERR